MEKENLERDELSHAQGNGDQYPGKPELKIILVGKTGAGKSATGNTILGQKVFDSKLSVKPVTEKCVKGSRSWNGREVVVIDTSAILDTKVPDEKTSREICRCIVLSSPGPHALVLVTQLGRYTEEDTDAVRRVQEIFGVEVMKHVIILFTRKEDLGDGSLSDYVTHSDNRDLQKLIDKCGNRYCAFNNKATGAEQDAQVEELMGLMEIMVQEVDIQMRYTNGGRYTNETYQYVEKMLQLKMDELQKIYKEEMERKREEIIQCFTEKCTKIKEESNLREEELKEKLEKQEKVKEDAFLQLKHMEQKEMEAMEQKLLKELEGIQKSYEEKQKQIREEAESSYSIVSAIWDLCFWAYSYLPNWDTFGNFFQSWW